MTDKQRLELLKEVAGTHVYEERRQESLKIMDDTNNKREKIQEVITYIEERLAELEEEKKELSEYQLLDKQKRSLEWTLYDKELTKAKEQVNTSSNRAENLINYVLWFSWKTLRLTEPEKPKGWASYTMM